MRRQTFMGWLVRCLPAHDGLFCRIGYLADRHDQCLFLVMWGIFNWELSGSSVSGEMPLLKMRADIRKNKDNNATDNKKDGKNKM